MGNNHDDGKKVKRKAQCNSDTATYIQGQPSLSLEARAYSATTNVLATTHIDVLYIYDKDGIKN